MDTVPFVMVRLVVTITVRMEEYAFMDLAVDQCVTLYVCVTV